MTLTSCTCITDENERQYIGNFSNCNYCTAGCISRGFKKEPICAPYVPSIFYKVVYYLVILLTIFLVFLNVRMLVHS